jgi:hypothetical protein
LCLPYYALVAKAFPGCLTECGNLQSRLASHAANFIKSDKTKKGRDGPSHDTCGMHCYTEVNRTHLYDFVCKWQVIASAQT